MPIFSSERATTVRQRSPWLLSKAAYGTIFLAVVLSAYGWMCLGSNSAKVDEVPRATAEVCISHPDFAVQPAWREIFEQAKTEVRENLRMEVQRSGQETTVAISLSRLPAETIVPLVNGVASDFEQACRTQWKLPLEQAHRAAQENVRQTERGALAAQARFELLRQRRLKALADLRPVAPQSTTIENPRWTEICRSLADLEERRKILLSERTPLHPSIQEIEMRITDARREMASIPPTFTRESPAVSPRKSLPSDAPAPTEVQAARQAAEQLTHDLQQAQVTERAAARPAVGICASTCAPPNRGPRRLATAPWSWAGPC